MEDAMWFPRTHGFLKWWEAFVHADDKRNPYSVGCWLGLGRAAGEPASIAEIHGWMVTRVNGDQNILLFDGTRYAISSRADKVLTTEADMERLKVVSYKTQNPIVSYRKVRWVMSDG